MRSFFLAALVLVALAESALGILGPRRVATEDDWRSAADRVRKELAADDLIVFSPAWSDQVGRKHLGDLMPVTMVARADSARYARIWELSTHDAHAEEVAGLTPTLEEHHGRITLRRYEQKAARVLRDLTSDFAEARVALRPRGGGAEQACTVDGIARRCGATRVEPRVLEIDYRPRRGVLVPVAPEQTTTIAYDDVEGGTLVGWVGLHDYYARKSADGVVMVRVRVDGGLQTVTLPLRNEDGWKRYTLELPPGKHALRFEVDAEHPAFRLVGMHAEVRAP